MRIIDAGHLETKQLFEVNRPASSAPPPVYSVSVHSYRRCHRDGMVLNEYGDCGRCFEERVQTAARTRRNGWITAAIVLCAIIGAAALAFWKVGADRHEARTAAAVISARNPDKPTVYTMKGCPACTMAVNQLDGRGIAYVERRIDLDGSAMAELASLNGRGVVPTFVIGDEVIEGLDSRRIEAALAKHGMNKTTLPAAAP